MFSVFRKPLTVRRYAAGSFSAGIFQPGQMSEGTLVASVQPTATADREVLPEGLRSRQSFNLFASNALSRGDESAGKPADRVQIGGEWYECAAVLPWQNNLLPHHQMIVVRIDPETAGA